MSVKSKRWQTGADLWEKLGPAAREQRRQPTEAEYLLWQRLRRHQVRGLSFRRQHSLGRFIVDFYCRQANLVIEVDGEIHRYQQEADAIRQEYLESLGLKVNRFSNHAVLNNLDGVMQQIDSLLP